MDSKQLEVEILGFTHLQGQAPEAMVVIQLDEFLALVDPEDIDLDVE